MWTKEQAQAVGEIILLYHNPKTIAMQINLHYMPWRESLRVFVTWNGPRGGAHFKVHDIAPNGSYTRI